MLTQSVGRSEPSAQAHLELVLDKTIKRYRSAVERLIGSFVDRQPVAIVVSDGRFGSAHVVGKFLELVAEDADICMVTRPCENATTFMQGIVRDIGFSSGDLSLSDLESVLDLFLQHQQKKKRRTVIAVQDFHSHGWWVLDKIRRLIELEAEKKNGLLLVLSGPPSATEVLNEPILDIIAAHAGDKVELKPFTLSETRDFVRRHMNSAGATGSASNDSGETIEFFATNLIHEICNGVPDDVYKMCNTCLELFENKADNVISVDTVREAAILTGLAAPDNVSDAGADADISPEVVPAGRLVIESVGEPPEEVSLDQSSIVVGRDRLCDVCISGLKASRFHALFSLTTHGLVVADLASTNGTTVNGNRIDRYTLESEDVVLVGDTRITYYAGGEQLMKAAEPRPNGARSGFDHAPEPSINFVGNGLHLLKTS